LPSFPQPDESLSATERAEALAWVAYIDGRVTDLIVGNEIRVAELTG
jgi:hypothetical protein